MIGRIKLGGGKCDQNSFYEIHNKLNFLKESKLKQSEEKQVIE